MNRFIQEYAKFNEGNFRLQQKKVSIKIQDLIQENYFKAKYSFPSVAAKKLQPPTSGNAEVLRGFK